MATFQDLKEDALSRKGQGATYHCDYCRKDITGVIRIKCAACKDFNLCVECFAHGRQVYPHKASHPYRVVHHVTTPIFEPDWGADEELQLLEAIEMFGFGNWSDVANHVGTKTKQQCEQHYWNVYLSGPTAPLPDLNAPLPQPGSIGHSTLQAQQQAHANSQEDRKGKKKTGKPAAPKPKPRPGLGHLVGYMPLRGDFETEWDNDAEQIIADMEFREDDTPWERELKLKVLEIYNHKLDERAARKKFILERGLLEKKPEKKRSKEEKEVYNNLRVFARFHSEAEHEQLIQGLLNEMRLRKRIEQLQQYRINGIRTLAEGELFDLERKKKQIPPGGKKRGLDGGDLSAMDPSAATAALLAKKRKAEPGAAGPVITSADGSHLLSEQEKKLCAELQLLPKDYMAIKERLIRECYARGYLQPGQAGNLIQIDINKTNRLFDFFVSCGWINTSPQLAALALNPPPLPPATDPSQPQPVYSVSAGAVNLPHAPGMSSSPLVTGPGAALQLSLAAAGYVPPTPAAAATATATATAGNEQSAQSVGQAQQS